MGVHLSGTPRLSRTLGLSHRGPSRTHLRRDALDTWPELSLLADKAWTHALVARLSTDSALTQGAAVFGYTLTQVQRPASSDSNIQPRKLGTDAQNETADFISCHSLLDCSNCLPEYKYRLPAILPALSAALALHSAERRRAKRVYRPPPDARSQRSRVSCAIRSSALCGARASRAGGTASTRLRNANTQPASGST